MKSSMALYGRPCYSSLVADIVEMRVLWCMGNILDGMCWVPGPLLPPGRPPLKFF